MGERIIDDNAERTIYEATPDDREPGQPGYWVSRRAVWKAGAPQAVAEAAENTIGSKLEQRLVDLQAIIDRQPTVLADNTVGAIRAAIRDVQSELKTLARVDRLQTRKLLRLLEGTD